MRHRVKTVKLQRDAAHRKALLSNLACSLIEHRRIRTTLAKAKALRPVAERLVTLGKRGDLHARRQAIAALRQPAMVGPLFDEIAPASKDRQGGYTRIIKLGQRQTDSAPMAFIEWVDAYVPASPAVEAAEPAAETIVDDAPEVEAPKKKATKKKAAAAAAE